MYFMLSIKFFYTVLKNDYHLYVVYATRTCTLYCMRLSLFAILQMQYLKNCRTKDLKSVLGDKE